MNVVNENGNGLAKNILQMLELGSSVSQQVDSEGIAYQNRMAASSPSYQPMSVSVVTEFIRWNEEAVQRCTVLTPQVFCWWCFGNQ
jgi:hypothetical protein